MDDMDEDEPLDDAEVLEVFACKMSSSEIHLLLLFNSD